MIEISYDFEKVWIKNTRRSNEGAGIEEKNLKSVGVEKPFWRTCARETT